MTDITRLRELLTRRDAMVKAFARVSAVDPKSSEYTAAYTRWREACSKHNFEYVCQARRGIEELNKEIEKAATDSLPALLDELEAARKALTTIRDEHVSENGHFCRMCGAEGGRWPCGTHLEARDALSAHAAAGKGGGEKHDK